MADISQRTAGGSVAAAISNSAVRLLAEYTGRGPTKARTTLDRELVVVVLGDSLTKGEATLARKGEGELVLEMRHRFQNAMRQDLTAAVEVHTGRKVIAFMSANHIDPDLAVEVFVLDEPFLGAADVAHSHDGSDRRAHDEDGSSQIQQSQ